MIDFFFQGYFFLAMETYACPILDTIIIIGIFRVAFLLTKLIVRLDKLLKK